MSKAIWSIIAASTGSGAFTAWLLAIWSDHQTEWSLTAVLLTATALAASVRSSFTLD